MGRMYVAPDQKPSAVLADRFAAIRDASVQRLVEARAEPPEKPRRPIDPDLEVGTAPRRHTQTPTNRSGSITEQRIRSYERKILRGGWPRKDPSG